MDKQWWCRCRDMCVYQHRQVELMPRAFQGGLSQSLLVSPGSSVELVRTQRGHDGTCWAPLCSIGTHSAPPWSPGMTSLQHHHPHIPPSAPMALTAASMQEDDFWGASLLVEPPKCMSQTTGRRGDPVTTCAIRLGMGLTLTHGLLQGVSLPPSSL